MSSRRRKKERAGGPMSAAGLMRFYEEIDVGIKLSPYTVVIVGVIITVLVIVLGAFLPPP